MAWFLVGVGLVDLVGYWLHRLAHRPWSPLYRSHMFHHVTQYPPRDLVSETYRPSGADSLAIYFAPFFLTFVGAAMLTDHWIALTLGGAVAGGVSALLHDLTHLSGSGAARSLPGVVRHHLDHHRKMGRNFGIVTTAWDRLFGTSLGTSLPRPPARPR